MKTFIKFFGVLFILLFQFTSCLNDDDRKPIYFFYDEPVVVDQMGDYPTIRNQSNLFYVPELAGDETLKAGDLLWTSFIVDLDNEKDLPSHFSTNYYIAEHFNYEIVDSAKVIIPANAEEFQSYLSDDYTAPIELSVLYHYAIDSLWFFGFKQRDQSNQLSHTYELILNPELENGSYPTLYIRSKQINASAEGHGKARSRDGYIIFAFDVNDFVDYYRQAISSSGYVRFNLKYKTDVDVNGNDIYKEFMSNPISWDFSLGKPQ